MIRAFVAVLLLSSPALAGHLTELHGERAVVFGGRTWTWEQLQAKRAEAPARFDAFHATLGWVLSHPDAATARRNISPDRFDRYHPYLGWLLAGLAEWAPVPEMPGKGPGCPPEAPVGPNAIAEPSSLAIVTTGLLGAVAWVAGRRGWKGVVA